MVCQPPWEQRQDLLKRAEVPLGPSQVLPSVSLPESFLPCTGQDAKALGSGKVLANPILPSNLSIFFSFLFFLRNKILNYVFLSFFLS